MSDFISKSALIETLDYHGMLSLQSDIVPGIERVGDIVRHFPTINVVPVVHARWVDGKCSRCKTAVLAFSHKENDGFGAVTVGNGDYCSNCGAKMDGEAE